MAEPTTFMSNNVWIFSDESVDTFYKTILSD